MLIRQPTGLTVQHGMDTHMQITARVMNGSDVVRTITCNVPDMPTDHETLFALATDAYTIAAQSRLRLLGNPSRKSGRMSDADIAREMATWKWAQRSVTRDPVKSREKIAASINRMDADARAALLAMLQSQTPALVKSSKKRA